MSCYLTDKNLRYTKEKHSNTYSADFFINNTFFLSNRGTGPVPRVLVAIGSPVKGCIFPSEATATVTIKLQSAGGGDRSVAASAVPLDGFTTTLGTPCPLAVSSPISSSTVPLVGLGFGELPKKVKKKGEIKSENASKSRKSTRNAMTSTHLDAPMSSPAGEALTMRF
jgi:hypothetical protein